MKIERNKEESYLSFVTRITAALNDGLIDYQQWGRAVVGEDLYSEESTRRIAKFFSQFIQNLENDEIELIEDKDKANEIKQLLEELAKSVKKFKQLILNIMQIYVVKLEPKCLMNKLLKQFIT